MQHVYLLNMRYYTHIMQLLLLLHKNFEVMYLFCNREKKLSREMSSLPMHACSEDSLAS